jgi:hypothetical protein
MAGYLMAIVHREAGFATALRGPEAGSPAGQSNASPAAFTLALCSHLIAGELHIVLRTCRQRPS